MTTRRTPSASRPPTLRALAGIESQPSSVRNVTLLVIDAQLAYAPDGVLALDGVERATSQIRRLLAEARAAGGRVIHIAHVGPPGSPFDPCGGGRFIPDTAPTAGERVITKRLPNAFAGTELAVELRAEPSDGLLVCGFMTHMCVSSTTRAALDLGFDATVVADATATRALPSPIDSDVVAAEAVQRAALAALADRFANVTSTHRVLQTAMATR